MSDGRKEGDDVAAKSWAEADTEPLGVRARQGGPASRRGARDSRAESDKGPDSSGAFDANGNPRKAADAKRSVEVEAMLDALSYERPRMPVSRAVTDGDVSAAHRTGPRAVPVGVNTPEPEPPLVLSHSLVGELEAPTPPSGRSPIPVVTDMRRESTPKAARVIAKGDDGEETAPVGRAAVTTVVIARKRVKVLAIALVPTAILVSVGVWASTRGAPLPPSSAEGVSRVEGAPMGTTPTAASVATEIPSAKAPAPIASAAPSATGSAAPAVASASSAHAAAVRPGTKRAGSPPGSTVGKVGATAPSASARVGDTGSIHTEFDLER